MIGNVSGRDSLTFQKRAVVMGGGGFIGHHLARRLMSEGYWVRIVDLQPLQYCGAADVCDDYMIGDLRNVHTVRDAVAALSGYAYRDDEGEILEVYQLAADMGGAGFVFTGDHDADIMHNSAQINLNVAEVCSDIFTNVKIFYSSSACMYPEHNQLDTDNPNCSEESAYPANPDSEYGWEKLFSERLFLAYARNYDLDVRIGRFHNIFGPEGTWEGGREKAPAAFCRKIAMADQFGTVEMWGDGKQTRSFLYIDECVEAVRRLMESDFQGPVNIGSEEMVSMNDFMEMIAEISSKRITVKHIPGPEGVRGRNSDNTLIEEKLGWKPTMKLRDGIMKTYFWISEQVEKKYGVQPLINTALGCIVNHVDG